MVFPAGQNTRHRSLTRERTVVRALGTQEKSRLLSEERAESDDDDNRNGRRTPIPVSTDVRCCYALRTQACNRCWYPREISPPKPGPYLGTAEPQCPVPDLQGPRGFVLP